MTLTLPLIALLVAGQTPGPVDPNAPLPPNHPPMNPAPGGSAAPAQRLPEVDPNAPLPPNHPPMGGAQRPAGPAPDELVKQLDAQPELRTQDKPFEISLSAGKLYYSVGRYPDAAEYLGQAWAKAAPLRALAKKTKPAPGDCAEASLPLEQLLSKVQAQPALAATCVPRAMISVAEAGELRANALFLTGDAKGALALLDEVLAVAPDRASALYARGGVRLDSQANDVAALKKAKADLARVAQLQQGSGMGQKAGQLVGRIDQLIAAGGAKKFGEKVAAEVKANPPLLGAVGATAAASSPQQPQQVDPLGPIAKEAMEAVQNTERTPELMAGLAKLVDEGEVLLAQKKYDEALGNYVRVMPFEPENSRAQAGMAWAMVGLKRPAADRIWNVAAQRDPAAIEKLGEVLQAKGDREGALGVWRKLAQTRPDYARQSGLDRRLQ